MRCDFVNFVDDFLFSLYSKSENTQKTYSYILKDFTQKNSHIDLLTVEHIEQYIISLKRKYKPSSINLAINVIKSFYNYLGENGYKNIGKHLKTSPCLPCEQRILSIDEYKTVCESGLEQYKKDCFIFLCNTGLRVSEFVSLKPENISNGFLRVVGKGRKKRAIPLNSTTKEVYSRNPNFEMIKKKNRGWVFRQIKKIGKEAGIPPFHPHSCRHFFANELYHKGIPMHTVSRLLGHSCTMVTESVYVHWSGESLSGSTDVLG